MKLIKQSAEIWEQKPGEIGIYKQIEKVARLCYASTDKITEDSYKRFIGMLKENGHNSPLEHGTVYLDFTGGTIVDAQKFYQTNPYSKGYHNTLEEGWVEPHYYVTTNYRALIEGNRLDDLQCLCKPTQYHPKRISVHMITSIGISREANRHRCHSVSEQSTRYCNFSKDKFGRELTFILPSWIDIPVGNYSYWDGDWCNVEQGVIYLHYGDKKDVDTFLNSCRNADMNYKVLLNKGWKPQQAREVLPLSTKTELVHTAFEEDWKKFFKLRCSPAAHPMMQELANMIKDLIL